MMAGLPIGAGFAVQPDPSKADPVRWGMQTMDGVIRNPDNAQHYMQLDVLDQVVRISFEGEEVAVSNRAMRLLEVGRRLYQPQYYIPIEHIAGKLVRTEKSTHCPLKGNAAYFDLSDETGIRAKEIAWSYPEPYDFAVQLAGHIAFDPKRVSTSVEAVR